MSERIWAPIIDQHATCIAVNPVQGCPKKCAYCFLNERGLTATRPEEMADPEATLEQLLASPFYDPSRVLALYTWTDVMATSLAMEHLTSLLRLFTLYRLPNAITLITKCLVPDKIVEAIAAARSAGQQIIIYLSYSGLGPDIEKGVKHEHLRSNFPRLAAQGIPIIHYWRPVFPVNARKEVMEHVLELAVAYATCSIVAGLKVETQARQRLSQWWPALADHPQVDAAEGVFPQSFWQFVHDLPEWAATYPIFHTNSCALAYVLKEADRFAIYSTPVCTQHNRCPLVQQQRCSGAVARRSPLQFREIANVLSAFGYPDVTFTIDNESRSIHIASALPTNIVASLTQQFTAKISAPRDQKDTYWSSGTAGAQPLILE